MPMVGKSTSQKMPNYQRAREVNTYFYCGYEFTKRAKGWLNPVKHGLANAPKDWPCSTFHRYVKKGLYPKDWGATLIELGPDVGRE